MGAGHLPLNPKGTGKKSNWIKGKWPAIQSDTLARPIVGVYRPSIQSRARPTHSPSNLTETQSKYFVECYDIYSIHSHYTTQEVAQPAAARPLLRFPL